MKVPDYVNVHQDSMTEYPTRLFGDFDQSSLDGQI